MSSAESTDDNEEQSKLSETWGNRNPGPKDEEPNTEDADLDTLDAYGETSEPQDDEADGRAAAIAQSPQPVVDDGIDLPQDDESAGTETWGGSEDTSHGQTVETLLKTTEKEPEPESEQREPIRAVSTYASDPSPVAEHRGSNVSPKQSTKKTVGRSPIEKSCPDCDGEVVVEENDHYCDDCGLLLSDTQIDPGPEWRAFDQRQQQNRKRVGGPMKENMHDKGLTTVIGGGHKDASGNPMSASRKRKVSRLRKWDARFKVQNTKERNLRQAFGEIQRISSEMDLPDYVEETACTVYRRALNDELLPGRSIEGIATASVYVAMRQAKIPKTSDRLMEYARVEKDRVTGCFSYLCRELGLEIEPPKVTEHLNRVSSELAVTTETQRKAEELIETSVQQNLHSGKVPSGMAAAAIYAATMLTRCDRVTQEAASNAGDVCELTIRNRQRELLDAVGVDYESVSPPSPDEVEANRT